MNSIFTDKINLEKPFEGHPNPYFERARYVLLNGWWDFEVNKDEKAPGTYNSKIVVPFSPETPLSHINRRISKDDWMHYRKTIILEDEHVGKRGMLYFTAVDQVCTVTLNGVAVGQHKGGYNSFSFEIEKLEKTNTLEVTVQDDTDSEIFARGKQMNKNGGIWYTPTSGIWGEVYLEILPDGDFVKSLKINANCKTKNVLLNMETAGNSEIFVEILFQRKTVVQKTKLTSESIDLSDCFHPWSPEDPNTYDILIYCDKDVVKSSFGFKLFEKRKVGENYYLFLNEKPIFLSSLLDQGYWPDGGLTPPGIKAIKHDILTIKKAGFNCLRKHIKIESMRWYYECDRNGVVVMQDMMNSGSKYSWWLIHLRPFIDFDVNDNDNKILGRGNPDSMVQFEKDMIGTLKQLDMPTCICVWTLFNEGWGQFRAKEMLDKMNEYSGDKLIDATSGWYDKGVGDFNSRHIYFRAPKMKSDGERVLSLSEFGGYSLLCKGHAYSEKKTFGYSSYKDNSKLNKALEKVYGTDLIREIKNNGLSIAVYTQISDVEEEINGLMTYDRAIFKPNIDLLKTLNERLYATYQKTIEEKSK